MKAFAWAGLAVLGSVFTVITLVDHFGKILTVWFAPRLYIIEWLSTLVKGASR